MKQSLFNEKKVLHDLVHYLPSQTPLKDFIHHNSLHAYQFQSFFEAIFSSSTTFGHLPTLSLAEFRTLYEVGRIRPEVLERILLSHQPGTQLHQWKFNCLTAQFDEHINQKIGHIRGLWKQHYAIDLDNKVQPFLFRVLCSYLDQGISIWQFPLDNAGFLASVRKLEKESYGSFFSSSRARSLFLNEELKLTDLLDLLVGNDAFYSHYLFDQQFSHKGWSGLVAAIEKSPDTLLSPKKIGLQELIHFELLLEIDALDQAFGSNWVALASHILGEPQDYFEYQPLTTYQLALRYWQEAFEWSYYDEVLAGVQQINKSNQSISESETQPSTFQALFCIDERECSLRRHLEYLDPKAQTFGTPGYFHVEFYYQAYGAKFYDKLCPAPVTPNYLIKEFDVTDARKHDLMYSSKTHQLITGFLSTLLFGFWAAYRLVVNLLKPKMSPAISNAFAHMNAEGQLTVVHTSTLGHENGLQVGFTVAEMTDRVASLLQGIALTQDFASLVYVVAHGSSSANNPHHGAHDCGACSGRPGSVNARVFAHMANEKVVRVELVKRGIHIPDTTRFVGALHDTAADEIVFYDLNLLADNLAKHHQENASIFEKALDLNAKERSRRFASIDTKQPLAKVRMAIKRRSVSLFEPRPELGHGTNTLCIVGRRSLTKGLFLDRRAFLNSYDYRTDLDGKFLTAIMKPLGPVCGGINLEYYFSRVDNYKLGAGTKLPHNVMGLVGVANSSDGDLRPGLPWQMIEVHDPLRLLIVVEHFPDVVLKTIQAVPEMYQWFANEWVHLSVVHPETADLYYFKNDQFVSYVPQTKVLHFYKDVHTLIEEAKEMETNHIAHATQENLPIYFTN
ncbi:MAG: hypothetical protein RIT03_1883 [Bacteroidota bacterium]|jgi:uncharacterized protein YbcC (UPF0753/DUF2309 family)